jgi:phytoene dehydrogenase-like protein
MPEHDVVIVGGGLAGLACALVLQEAGAASVILEAGDGLGGRVRTDRHEGFLLDRGFQVLLDNYPECRRILDYDALKLRPFFPGVEIRIGGRFVRFSDPHRRPQDALRMMAAPVGTFADKLRVAQLRKDVLKGEAEAILQGPNKTILADLRDLGIGSEMIDLLFRPFFGGVLLDGSLSDSSRVFRYVFRMFSQGEIALPSEGMGQIPRQLASRLPESSIRLNCRATEVRAGAVTVESGEVVTGDAVVVATDGLQAASLLEGIDPPRSKGTVCLYFEVPELPISGPVLVLDGERSGPVNNLAVLSEVSPDYAPPGRHLVSVSCIGSPESAGETAGVMEALEGAVRRQMTEWFGRQVESWRHLRTYHIPHAQPGQSPESLELPEKPVRLGRGLFVCGDHRETASIQGALHSGRRAAEAILAG